MTMTLQQTTKLQTYEAARSCMQPKNPTIGSGYDTIDDSVATGSSRTKYGKVNQYLDRL